MPVTQATLAAWARRPASAVNRLAGRALLVLSARDLLRAALDEQAITVAFTAPSAAAMAGFARAARDLHAPLVLSRPSGAADEVGPEEARDDAWFVNAALGAAEELRFLGPMVLLKEPPRAGSAVPEHDRVFRELEAGFTGVALAARVDDTEGTRDAALSAAQACHLELGLEVVPIGGSPQLGLEVVQMLAARGAMPSSLRLTGHETEAAELLGTLPQLAVTTTDETTPERLAPLGVRQLIAAGPFLRALKRSAPPDLWERLIAWGDERNATLEQAAARHQRLLRELPAQRQERLEALCCFEAEELLRRTGAAGTAERLAARISSYVEG
jgi:hypothetical protein